MMSNNNNQPPPWSEAPPWAKWQAQDKDGAWFAYSEKPEQLLSDTIRIDNYGYWGNGGRSQLLKWNTPNPNWRDTLQKRPENE